MVRGNGLLLCVGKEGEESSFGSDGSFLGEASYDGQQLARE